jgi:hypothetical protein
MSDDSVLLWRHWGPLVEWDGGVLTIKDLNPETKLTWQMGAEELAEFGHKCILRAAEVQKRLPS